MTKRLLTKNEKNIVESRVYAKLYAEELNELYKKADKWLKDRRITEYDEVSGNGFKYFISSGSDPDFDSRVKNTRVRGGIRDHVSIIKRYSDGSGYMYSGQSVATWSLGNTDHIFNEAYKILTERDWEDLNDAEYFGYDPNDYI